MGNISCIFQENCSFSTNMGSMMGNDFIKKVAKIINEEELGINAEVKTGKFGDFISLTQKTNNRRVYVLSDLSFSYFQDGPRMEDTFFDDLRHVLLNRISPAYFYYCAYIEEIQETRDHLKNIIKVM